MVCYFSSWGGGITPLSCLGLLVFFFYLNCKSQRSRQQMNLEPRARVNMAAASSSNTCGLMERSLRERAPMLLTDLYQFTMAYAYWRAGRHQEPAAFELFFRDDPFGGGFSLFAGLHDCLLFLRSFRFTDEGEDVALPSLCSLLLYLKGALRNGRVELKWHHVGLSSKTLSSRGGCATLRPRDPFARVSARLREWAISLNLYVEIWTLARNNDT